MEYILSKAAQILSWQYKINQVDNKLEFHKTIFWFYHRKPKIIDISKITFFRTYRNLKGTTIVMGYSENGQDFLYKIQGTDKSYANSLKESVVTAGAKLEESVEVEPNLVAKIWCSCFFFFGNKKVFFENAKVKQEKKLFWFIHCNPKVLDASKIVFFDVNRGVLGQEICSGYKIDEYENNRFEVKGLNKEKVLLIKNYLLSNGAQIEDYKGREFQTELPIFRPLRWFLPREKLIFTEKGVAHKFIGFFHNRTTFLPYDGIRFFFSSHKSFLMYGDATINVGEQFSSESASQIIKLMEDKHILKKEGKKYRPSFLSFSSAMFTDTLITTKEGVLYTSNGLSHKMVYIPYKDITSYYKTGSGLFVKIHINGTGDVRTGNKGLSIDIPDIFYMHWRYLLFINGSLRSTLKDNCLV